MREIKFRGKSIETGAWVDGDLVVDINEKCSLIDYANHTTDTYTWNDVIPETVGQYTGLKDKNGKEIYEGDIVKCKGSIEGESVAKERIGKFIFCTLHHGFQIVLKDRDGFTYPKSIHYSENSLEVIGNIYENPELLTKH